MIPTVGRIVHFHITERVVRPAIIVHVWSDTCVQLQVFVDGTNDDEYFYKDVTHNHVTKEEQKCGVAWRTSVDLVDENNIVGCWSWPVR